MCRIKWGLLNKLPVEVLVVFVYEFVSHPRRMDILSKRLQKHKTMQADNSLCLCSHHPPTPNTKAHNGVHNSDPETRLSVYHIHILFR
jgi:hypothetical protein